MKELFPSYYPKANEQLQGLWDKGLFVLDASVLLKLYELTPTTRREFMRVLKRIANRIWVPYEVASEYQGNRIQVIQKQLKMADSVLETLKQIKKNVQNALPKEHPFVDAESVEEIIKACQRAIRKLKRREGEYRRLLEHDVIREELDRLLSGRIGEPYDTARLIEICEIAQKRYRARIPPGYADESKTGGNPFGDVIIWFQIIDKAKVSKRPIIFVTDDRKEDWWINTGAGELNPRQELIDEIKHKAGTALYMYTPATFFKEASVYLQRRVPKDTIDELARLAKWEYVEALKQIASQLEAQLPPTYYLKEALKLVEEMQAGPSRSMQESLKALQQYYQSLVLPRIVLPWLGPEISPTGEGSTEPED